MKKKSLLLILLMALMMPWAANAQQTLTVYEDETGTSNKTPIYTYYFDAFSRAQTVFPAEDLGEMEGGTITAIKFYTTYTNDYETDVDVDVYLTEVANSTITSFVDLGNATTVYTGHLIYVKNPDNNDKAEVTITLSTPYAYGGGNLLFGCDNKTKGDYENIYYCGKFASGASIYGNNSSSTPTTATASNFLPITTFTYTQNASGCDMPTSIAVNSITHNSATVTWDGDGNKWNLRYKASTDADYTLVENLTDKTYTFNKTLEGNTTYSIGVQTVCSGSTSNFKSTTFTTLNPCAAPTNLVFTNITTSSARLSWTAGYQETSWTVQYKQSSDSEWSEKTVYNAYIDLTGLESCKKYNVKIYNCENYLSGDFITKAAIPFTEDFVYSSTPVGWARYSGLLSDVLAGTPLSTGGSWTFGTGSNGVFNSHAYLNIYGSSCRYWLVTPSMMMYDNVQLSFDVALTKYSGTLAQINTELGADDLFVVLISTDNGAHWTILRQWDNAGSAYVYNNIPCTAVGQNHKIDLSAYAGQEIAIAFYGESTISEDNSDNNIHIDNVSINYIPSCEIPTGLAHSNVTAHTVDLNWASDASAWIVAYKTSEEADFTEVYANTNNFTLTGLAPETQYTAKVQTDCDGIYSDWSLTTSFTTAVACQAPTQLTASITPGNGTIATLKWIENGDANDWVLQYDTENTFANPTEFDGTFVVSGTNISANLTGLTPETTYFARVKAACGGIDGESSWSDIYSFTPTDAYIVIANDGTNTNNYVPFYGYYADSNSDSQFIIPASELTSMRWGTINKLTFYSNTNNQVVWENAVYDIYIKEVPNTYFESATYVDWSTMTKVYTGGVSLENNMMEFTLSEPYQYTGDNLLIGFDETTNSSNYPTVIWYGVNQSTNTAVYSYSSGTGTYATFLPKTTIEFTPGTEPSCYKPTGLSVNYANGQTATLSWDGGTSLYNINVNGIVTEGVTSPYVLQNLELSTTYEVMVQSDCGNTQSEWTSSISFTTPDCWDGHLIEYTLNDSYGDGWNGNAIAVYEGCETTGTPIATLTIGSGSSLDGSLYLCEDTYLFVWVEGNYQNETSWTFTEGGNVLFEGDGDSVNGNGELLYVIGTPMPTYVEVTDITAHEATVEWTSSESAWEVQLDDETPIYVTNTTYTFTGLDASTMYSVKVRTYINSSEQSCWSQPVNFTTTENCPVSTNLTASDITHNSVTLSWNGTSDSYNIRYKEQSSNNTTYSFDEDGNMEGWTTIDADGDGFVWAQHINGSGNNYATHSGVGIMTSGSYDSSSSTALTPDNYLVSPQFELGGTFSFWACAQDQAYPAEHFGVAVSTTGNTDDADFTTIQEWTMIAKGNRDSGAYYQFIVDLSAYSGMGYVAIRHFNCTDMFYLNVDDIAISTESSPQWNTVTSTDSSIILNGLTQGKTYEFQVQGICGIYESAWSMIQSFTIPTVILWENEWATVPTITESVTITDVVVIPNGYTAYADDITLEPGAQLIIEEGGQLIHNGDVTATIQKGITAYTSKDSDGWYLISSPVDGLSTSAVTTGTYDLFIYNEPNAYWYSNTGTAAPFNTLELTKGYLYANSANQTLSFVGDIIATETADIAVDLSYGCDAYPDLKGFNLMGNPFSRNLTSGDIKIGNVNVTTYYATDGGSDLDERNINEAPIKPGQGFMIQATAENQQLVFNPSSKDDDENNGYIKIVAGNDNGYDNAFIQIGNGNTLRKMSIANGTAVYVMNDGDDYAAARVEELAGTMPVNFKAVADGEYTITVNAKNIEASTMILFDDFTGEQIDLLETPSYIFKAETTDPENRFKLIFDFNNNYNGVEDNYTNGNFAYQSGDEIIISGEGELQVFDVLGRIVMSQNISGVKRISKPETAGVYLFVIVGEDMKTQKIVIR